MRITLTGGETYDIPDMCTCCRMSTAGEHELSCPLYQPLMRRETYPEFVKRGQEVLRNIKLPDLMTTEIHHTII